MILMPLVVVSTAEKILLGYKKRGFGQGRWNGFGGKVAEGETVEQAASREINEEINLDVKQLKSRGKLLFTFEDATEGIEMDIFEVLEYVGQPSETEEMRPQWFAHSDIPYDQMWADDKFWIPLYLQGKNIRGEFHFDAPGTQNILKHTIESYD